MAEEYSQKIINAKDELNKSLEYFVKAYSSCKDKGCISALVGEIVNRHSAILTTVNQVLSDVHQEFDFLSEANLRQEYLGTTENFLTISLQIINVVNQVAKKNGIIGMTVSSRSFNTIQTFINTFTNQATREKYIKLFTDSGIATEGFNLKFKKTMKKKYLYLQLWIGIPLLILCGFITFFGEKYLHQRFNGIQLIFLKALLALSISAVGSSLIEGTSTVNWKMQTALQVRAVGWVGVFLLLYFLNPASPSNVTGSLIMQVMEQYLTI